MIPKSDYLDIKFHVYWDEWIISVVVLNVLKSDINLGLRYLIITRKYVSHSSGYRATLSISLSVLIANVHNHATKTIKSVAVKAFCL